MLMLRENARIILIVLFLALGVCGCGRRSHRRVNYDRQNRNRIFIFQFAN